MAVSLNDQFYVLDPASPPGAGTNLTVQEFQLTDLDENGFISPQGGDSIEGMDITRVWVGDTVTVKTADGTEQTIEGVTLYIQGSSPVFTPTDGSILQDAEFVSSSFVTQSTQVALSDLEPVCFAQGSLIETSDGPRTVEELSPGDLIYTLDNGLVPLRGIYSARFPATGRFAPVRICAQALGNDRDLFVSQQHRILITGWRAELHFGAPEVLVAVKHLTNGDTIYVQEGGHVTYFHLLFARHELVRSAGIWSESYHPDHARDHASRSVLSEFNAMFPDEFGPVFQAKTARPVVPHFAANLLVPRHP